MKPRKICFIATHVYPLFNSVEKSSYGGSEVQLYTIAKEFAKDKLNKVSFVVGDFGQRDVEYYENVRVVKSFNPKSSGASVFVKAFQAIRYFFILVRLSPKVCFTSSANSTVGVVSFYCKLFGREHVHRIANIIDVNGYWVRKNGFLGKVYEFGLKRASKIVCQTVEQKKALKKNYGIDAVLFRNVFDFDNLVEHKKKDYVLWVGRASAQKRAKKFLELAKRNSDLDFVMICNNQDGKYFDEIYSDAKKIKNLKFIEKVPFEKIQKYYDEAKVFVSTSQYEGFANTFIQAGIGRTPIISLGSNPDDFLNEYECGLFAGDDFEKFNEDLRRIVSDKKLYEKFSKNVFDYVKKKYDIKKNMKVIRKIVER